MSRENLDDDFNATPALAERPPSREDVLGALKWSAPREVFTKRGPMLVSSAPATELVHRIWRENPGLRGEGYSMGEWRGKWEISKWEKVPEAVLVAKADAKEASRATAADINVPRPDGLEFLPFQLAGIAYALPRSGVLIGDEMGLGKTVQSIALMNCDPTLKTNIVICPASLKLNWKRELERWLVRKRPILIADSKTFTALADGVVIINYDVLHKHIDVIRTTDWDLAIIDEAHYLKNKDSRRTKMVFGEHATKTEKAKGMSDIPGIAARRRVLLTGTPIANKPAELFPLINYLDPIRWPSFWAYAKRYCNAHDSGFGWDVSGSSHLDELQDKLRETIMVRRLKKDVLTELPAKRRQVIEFPATGDLARVCRAEMAAFEDVDDLEAAVEMAAASDDPTAYTSAVEALKKGLKARFDEMAALRHETAVAKIPLVVEFLKTAVEESGKVIFFCWHKDVVKAVAAEFGGAAVQLVGDTPMIERQAAVDRFQTDPSCKLFIGSITAAGVGITLTAASHVVFGELDWVPGNVTQAEDRAHRIGQKESVLVQHLVLEGSLDATMARRIVRKQEVIDQALDVVTEATPDANGAQTRRKADPREALAQAAALMTEGQRQAAHEAIRMLATMCDGARAIDGSGFNKLDSAIGKDLAAMLTLSPKQAALAEKIARKYRRQLPDELVARMTL